MDRSSWTSKRLESLFGERLRVLTHKRIEVIARYISSDSSFFYRGYEELSA